MRKPEGHDILIPVNIAGSASNPSEGGRPTEDNEENHDRKETIFLDGSNFYIKMADDETRKSRKLKDTLSHWHL